MKIYEIKSVQSKKNVDIIFEKPQWKRRFSICSFAELAYNKPSKQSGYGGFEGYSHQANDGNRNPNMWPPEQNSCTETFGVDEPLWSVDLQADYPIKYVRFTNRNSDGMLECCWL